MLYITRAHNADRAENKVAILSVSEKAASSREVGGHLPLPREINTMIHLLQDSLYWAARWVVKRVGFVATAGISDEDAWALLYENMEKHIVRNMRYILELGKMGMRVC